MKNNNLPKKDINIENYLNKQIEDANTLEEKKELIRQIISSIQKNNINIEQKKEIDNGNKPTNNEPEIPEIELIKAGLVIYVWYAVLMSLSLHLIAYLIGISENIHYITYYWIWFVVMITAIMIEETGGRY